MSSTTKRRFFDRSADPTVASDEDFDAVFGTMTAHSTSVAQDIPVERIRPNPFQARAKFSDIEVLADSMRIHGFTSRLRVRRDPEQPHMFQLVYGERRLRAAHAAGISVVPCDVAEHTDAQMREIGLTENLQRSDLEPLEEARAFRLAIDGGGYSIRTLAAQIGKSKGYVQNRLDILRAAPDVLAMVDAHPHTLTVGVLIGQLATPELRKPLIERAVRGELDTETVRTLVRQIAVIDSVPIPTLSTPHRAANAQSTHASGHTPAQRMDSITTQTPSLAHDRAVRQRMRTLARATQTLETMLTQLQQLAGELHASDRAKLRDLLAERYVPAINQLLNDLESPES